MRAVKCSYNSKLEKPARISFKILLKMSIMLIFHYTNFFNKFAHCYTVKNRIKTFPNKLKYDIVSIQQSAWILEFYSINTKEMKFPFFEIQVKVRFLTIKSSYRDELKKNTNYDKMTFFYTKKLKNVALTILI